ncbi:hypothetical protein C8R47DRAFT_1165638 [Mycena vitilis]|nr:hypothetical protein C8R47DRAFT_1165638 [Mycena vitilis]
MRVTIHTEIEPPEQRPCPPLPLDGPILLQVIFLPPAAVVPVPPAAVVSVPPAAVVSAPSSVASSPFGSTSAPAISPPTPSLLAVGSPSSVIPYRLRSPAKSRSLARLFGLVAITVLESVSEQDSLYNLILLGPSRGVFVHSDWLFRQCLWIKSWRRE